MPLDNEDIVSVECKQALALEQVSLHLVNSVFSITDNFHISHLRLSNVAFLCCGPTTLIKQVLIKG
jgi:hypothetical protein